MEYCHLGSDSTEVSTSEHGSYCSCACGELCGWLWSGVQFTSVNCKTPPVSYLLVPLGEEFCVLIQVSVLGTTSQECMGTFEEPKFKFLFSCNHLLDLNFFFFTLSNLLSSLFLDHVFYILKHEIKLNILRFALSWLRGTLYMINMEY